MGSGFNQVVTAQLAWHCHLICTDYILICCTHALAGACIFWSVALSLLLASNRKCHLSGLLSLQNMYPD
jgi:hypothetical protein